MYIPWLLLNLNDKNELLEASFTI